MREKITYSDDLQSLPASRRERIKKRTEELLAGEMTLRELRKARKQSQEHLAKKLSFTQGEVSKLERRTDMYISSLRNYVHALGGELKIEVRFPSTEPIIISQFGESRAVVIATGARDKGLTAKAKKPTATAKASNSRRTNRSASSARRTKSTKS